MNTGKDNIDLLTLYNYWSVGPKFYFKCTFHNNYQMGLKIANGVSLSEVVIKENCSAETFHVVANELKTKLNVVFTDRLNGLEEKYWNFKYRGTLLTLHYNTYLGVTIFPEQLENASQIDNNNVIEVSSKLLTFL